MIYFPQDASVIAFIIAFIFVVWLIKKADKADKIAKNQKADELNKVIQNYKNGYEIHLSELKYLTAEDLNAHAIKFIP